MSDQWGEQKQKEMLELWQTHLSGHKSGFELFTSPIRANTSVVIIGYNAGGGKRNATSYNKYMQRFLEGEPEFSLPEKGHYEEGGRDYLVASRVRNYLFSGKVHLIKDAVETNRYFLRTEGKVHHRDVVDDLPEEAKKAYLDFCRDTTRELIERTEPRTVVDFSGENTADEFCNELGFGFERNNTHRFEDNKGFEAVVDVGQLTEEPQSTIISIKPHISHPWLTSGHLKFLERTVPPLLPD